MFSRCVNAVITGQVRDEHPVLLFCRTIDDMYTLDSGGEVGILQEQRVSRIKNTRPPEGNAEANASEEIDNVVLLASFSLHEKNMEN
ncbi:hypothetical protein EVAR_30953_1 [Eumeta japonica]|uniref:Uncharacterized protein n=1 Tax=Eumeta variegata TaxID=151549 RepID=A0A4C1V3H0_EUMVA|nr:hypothetical protein EVAR_30953_1 [Eumeta japonica]